MTAPRVNYKAQEQVHDGVLMNASEALRTTAAIKCAGEEYMRIGYDLALGGSGIADGDNFTISVLGSIDDGTTYRMIDFTKSDQTLEDLSLSKAITTAIISATPLSRVTDSLDIGGFDHVKVLVATDGTADADDVIDVFVRCWRE